MAAIAAALVFVLVLLPVVANAQTPPDCPPEPVAYEGTDDVVNELRAARHDAWASCMATIDRLEALGQDVDDLRASVELLETDATAGIRHTALVAAVEEAQAEPADQTPVVEAIDQAQLELDAALWFIAGLIIALWAGGRFAREVLG